MRTYQFESSAEAGFWGRCRQGLLLAVLLLVFLTGMRVWLVLGYAPADTAALKQDWLHALLMGLRFDAKWVASTLLPAWLLLALAQALPGGLRRLLDQLVVRVYAPLAVAALTLVSIVNHFYFGFYLSPINPIVFGLFEDDTGAILSTVWRDYPVVSGTLAWLAATALILWLAGRSRGRSAIAGWGKPAQALMVVLTVLGFALLARGSLGTFPLRETDVAVSTNSFINSTVPNGPQALYTAWGIRKEMDLGRDPYAGLKRFGFKTPLEAAHALGWQGDDEAALARSVSTFAKPSLSAPRPHVVFALMESFGRELLNTQDPVANDVLGRLAPHFDQDYYFSRAISIEHGTFPSLEGLLYGTPISPLTQSGYGYKPFPFSAVKPFKDAGYKVVFITSGSASWRGLDRSLKVQGFDEVDGMQRILQRFPNATTGTWGVDDDYMFRFASERLAEADRKGEKLMLFTLSVTNHPPYRLPADYRKRPLDVNRLPAHRTADTRLAQSIMETYQYANDSLGGFMDRVKGSALASHTIVTATGDHNSRSIFEYPDSSILPLKYGVPIYLYLPPAMRPHGKVDTRAWASHRDIFPTLYAQALGMAPSWWAGRNLLAPASRPTAVSFIQDEGGQGIVISDDGAAQNLTRPAYLRWNGDQLQPAGANVPEALRAETLRAQAWLALSDWRVRRAALAEKR